MITAPLFLDDAYLRSAVGRVVAFTDNGGIVLDRSIFYATSGGQPGDGGSISWDARSLPIASAIKGNGGAIVLQPEVPLPTPDLLPLGTEVIQSLDWERRYQHMRVHTALHLLSVVIPLPVTGGQIGTDRGRLDFDMPEVPTDIPGLEARLNTLIDQNLSVTTDWISDEELAANPKLIKTMSVSPPSGQGHVRLVRIGLGEDQIDLQPCGGTHVGRTGEIGHVSIGKIENKGRQNRRITLLFGN